jgi:hypothetical protein
MNNKQLNRMRIMNGLPPKKEKVVEAKVEEKPADPGYVWYSYGGRTMQIIQSPVILDPDTWIPRKGILTRYGKKLLAEGAKYYAKVTIGDLVKGKP